LYSFPILCSPRFLRKILSHLFTTLLPYTTLFRSCRYRATALWASTPSWRSSCSSCRSSRSSGTRSSASPREADERVPELRLERRSEEHTSELQSPYELVCSLLLLKKN